MAIRPTCSSRRIAGRRASGADGSDPFPLRLSPHKPSVFLADMRGASLTVKFRIAVATVVTCPDHEPFLAVLGNRQFITGSPRLLAEDAVVLDRLSRKRGDERGCGDGLCPPIGDEPQRDGSLGDHIGEVSPKSTSSSSCRWSARKSGPTTAQCNYLPVSDRPIRLWTVACSSCPTPSRSCGSRRAGRWLDVAIESIGRLLCRLGSPHPDAGNPGRTSALVPRAGAWRLDVSRR